MITNDNCGIISVVIGVTDEIQDLKSNMNKLFESCGPEDIAEIVFVPYYKTTREMHNVIQVFASNSSGFNIRIIEQQSKGFGYFLHDTLPNLNGKYVVYCVADNATDLGLIKTFAEKVREFPQSVVFASRWLPGGGFEGYGLIKMWLNHMFQKFIACMYHTTISDFSFAYQCIPVELYKSFNLKRSDMSVFFESRLRIIKKGCSIVEVPAVWKKRSEGKTKIRLGRVVSYLYVAFLVRFEK